MNEHAVAQDDVAKARQLAFVQRVKGTGKHWAEFDNVDMLCRLVLRDGWQRHERPRQLLEDPIPPALAELHQAIAKRAELALSERSARDPSPLAP